MRLGELGAALAAAPADGLLLPALRRWHDLEAQLAAMAAVEGDRVAVAGRAALDTGRLEAAVLPVCEGLRLDPDRFRADADRLGEALVAQAHAPALEALAHCDPTRATRWRAAARDAGHRRQVHDRYAGEAAIVALALREGVTRESARWVIETVEADYVTTPEWSALTAAAAARLDALARDPGARRVLGPVEPLTLAPAAEAAGASAQLDAALAAWPDAPSSVVVAEWVEGALTALDPHSRVVWPAEVSSWEAHNAGIRFDAGVTLTLREQAVVVTDLALEGPGFRAGLHIGDTLVSVGDSALASVSVDARVATADSGLAGPPETSVPVVVRRGAHPLPLTLTRSPYTPELVTGAERLPDNSWSPWLAPGIALVRIDAFRPWVDEAVDALLAPHLDAVQGVVLDLRGNGGGDVSAAVNVADRFVADGLLAGMDGRNPPDTDPGTDPATGARLAAWNEAVPGHALEGVPVVVLVDADTASAAEICAGALQQRANATVIGVPTVGKGRSQRLIGGPATALQLTNIRWTLPDGTVLDGAGLTPDLPLPLGPAARLRVGELHRSERWLAAHADGTHTPPPPPPLAGLPPLDDDPARLRALLLLEAERLGTL